MHMVDTGDVLHIAHHLCHLVHLNAFRDTIQSQPHTVAQQFPGTDEDHDSNQDTDNWVDDEPSCVLDYDAAYHNADTDQCVGSHVKKRTTNVEVAFLSTHEQQGCQAVDEYAYASCPRDDGAIDGGRFAQFVNAFGHNNAHSDE